MSRNLHDCFNIILVKVEASYDTIFRAVQPSKWFWLLTYIDPAGWAPRFDFLGGLRSQLLQREILASGSLGTQIVLYLQEQRGFATSKICTPYVHLVKCLLLINSFTWLPKIAASIWGTEQSLRSHSKQSKPLKFNHHGNKFASRQEKCKTEALSNGFS